MIMIQVTYNDNTSAIFQTKVTMILHRIPTFVETFNPSQDKSLYYTFHTLLEAHQWFSRWYNLTSAVYSRIAMPIPMPKKSAFKFIGFEEPINVVGLGYFDFGYITDGWSVVV